ncbi:hypothetical protein GH146_03860 [archaeon]|nr:hypothetical protein [archaeon]
MSKEETSKSIQLPNNGKGIIRLLTAELRNELKKPQGLLIKGPSKKNNEEAERAYR